MSICRSDEIMDFMKDDETDDLLSQIVEEEQTVNVPIAREQNIKSYFPHDFGVSTIFHIFYLLYKYM